MMQQEEGPRGLPVGMADDAQKAALAMEEEIAPQSIP